MRQVIIYPGEDGYFVAEVPSLPGCISQGKSKEEALINIREAIRVYNAALQDDNISVPEEHFDVLVAVVSRLPVMSGLECVKAPEKKGFYLKEA